MSTYKKILFGLKAFTTLIIIFVTLPQALGERSSVFENLPTRPDRPIMAFHFSPKHMNLDQAKTIIDKVDAADYNTVILEISQGIQLNRAPWTPFDDALTKVEFVELVKYMKKKNLQVIPELKLFTHQESFFGENYPDLMFNSKTYDPTNEEVYEIVVPLMAEIIGVIRPYAFHIGHDHVPIVRPDFPKYSIQPGEPTPHADVYKASIDRLQAAIAYNWGIETWIWGDMLIEPNEFPHMFYKHLHGDRGEGYGKTLRDRLNKDITVLDWHYFGDTVNFDSGTTLQEAGFDVLGAVWKTPTMTENHTKWAKENNYSGMVATSWQHASPLDPEHDLLDDLITDSSEVFHKYFAPTVFDNLPTRPDGPIIALHFTLRHMSLEQLKDVVDKAEAAGYNTLITIISQGIELNNAPWRPLPDALSRDEFIELVDYIHAKDLQIIPEIKLFTHQELFFNSERPDLMYNSRSYDPRKQEIYEIVVPLMGEIISITRPYAFHIGHDEVSYLRPTHPHLSISEDEHVAPAALFNESVNRLEKSITYHWGIETWIWGDMLIAPDEFPHMFYRHLHGDRAPGYGAPLRETLTKNITVIDWHYFGQTTEFNTGEVLQEHGFDVLGSTWKGFNTTENHTKWGAENNYSGMVATTWKDVFPNREEYDEEILDRIINETADTYLRYFK